MDRVSSRSIGKIAINLGKAYFSKCDANASRLQGYSSNMTGAWYSLIPADSGGAEHSKTSGQVQQELSSRPVTC